METKNIQPEVIERPAKEINPIKAVLTIVAIGAMLILSAMQVVAFATDKTLAGLEDAHASAVNSYKKNQEAAIKTLEALDSNVDTVCDSYMALKSYKEAKEYKILEPNYNPCQTMTGFRTFQRTETTSIQQPEQKQQEDSNSAA